MTPGDMMNIAWWLLIYGISLSAMLAVFPDRGSH